MKDPLYLGFFFQTVCKTFIPSSHTCIFQTVCKAIFISKAESLGLLRGTPPAIEKQLRNVLQECAYPKHGIYQLPVNNKSDRTVLKAITTLLKSSLKDEISTVNNVD